MEAVEARGRPKTGIPGPCREAVLIWYNFVLARENWESLCDASAPWRSSGSG